jgi:multidrug efflux pump subunit AcrB
MSICQASALFRASGQAGRALLATTAAIGLTAAIAMLNINGAPAVFTDSALPTAGSIILQADTPSALRANAEAMRARILAQPGAMQVELVGLNQTRLSVAYSAPRLAAAGLTEADLRAALPVDAAQSRPGQLALKGDTALGLQAVADMHVRGQRLGDVAMVERARLEPPVATMVIDGRPAVELVVK